jgi:hypothetical protein
MCQGLGGRTTSTSKLASKYAEVRFIVVIIVTREWIMHAWQFVTIVIVPKWCLVGLYNVGTYHKKFGWKKKKIKNYFVECPRMTLGKVRSTECQGSALGKDNGR